MTRKKTYTVTHEFRQHLAGKEHRMVLNELGRCVSETCEIRAYVPGDTYTGSAPAAPLRRGFIEEVR